MNATPPGRNSKGHGRGNRAVQSRQDASPRPYVVVIVAGQKRGAWGRFADVEAAASVASMLRRHGMLAVVETESAGA